MRLFLSTLAAATIWGILCPGFGVAQHWGMLAGVAAFAWAWVSSHEPV